MRRAVSACPARERGFTLVELMVVLVIIGLMAGVAVLAMPDPSGGVGAEAERFAARAKAAQESALINARSAAVRVEPGFYAVSRSESAGWREVGRFQWEDGTRPDIAGPIRVTFDATGVADPLDLTLRRGTKSAQIRISADGDISIRR